MIYSRQNILSLQFKAMTTLRRLTRAELFTRLQLIQTVEPIVAKAYKIAEEKVLRESLDDSPHGQKWHVSFHGSQFPGNNPMACPRQSLYRMMDFPDPEPTKRFLRQTAEQGKAFEADLVRTWDMAGILLSSPDPYNQTGFEYPEAWLTSSVDAIIKLGNMPLPVEIKQRSAEVIRQMKLGRGPFPEHVRQIKVQIAFIRLYQTIYPSEWTDSELCRFGIIYYGSRDNPLDVAEFRIDHDENFFVAGIEQLKRWRAYFEEDLLPELNPTRRGSKFGHPHGWRWSYPPCQFCSFKKTCQLDFQESNTTLSDSVGIARAKLVRPNYDSESARLRVRARWQERKDDRHPHSSEQSQAA